MGPRSTVDQRRYPPCCETKGFPTSANFNSNLFGKERNSQILVNLLVTIVPSCTVSNAKTIGLKHLQFLDMGASIGSLDGARVVYRWTDVLLVEQNSVSDEETTPPV